MPEHHQFNDASSPRATLEQFTDQLARAQFEH